MIKEKKQPNGNKCQHLSSACDSFVLCSVKPAALPGGVNWKLICMRVSELENYKCGKSGNGCSTLVEPNSSSVLILKMSFRFTFYVCLCAFVSMCVSVCLRSLLLASIQEWEELLGKAHD